MLTHTEAGMFVHTLSNAESTCACYICTLIVTCTHTHTYIAHISTYACILGAHVHECSNARACTFIQYNYAHNCMDLYSHQNINVIYSQNAYEPTKHILIRSQAQTYMQCILNIGLHLHSRKHHVTSEMWQWWG